MDAMGDSAPAVSAILKALGNRHRLMILRQLLEGEQAVGAFADVLRLRYSTVSQHLARLRRDGLVCSRRDGRKVWYSLVGAPARRLVETLDEIYFGLKPVSAHAPRRPRKGKAITHEQESHTR